MINNDFRHVCFKDLQDYLRRDDYFSSFSEEEIQKIKENLGLVGDSTVKGQIIKDTYENIYQLVLDKQLVVGNIYIVNDFQTIYLEQGEILGTDDSLAPSQKYDVLLFPTSSNTFDTRVSLVAHDDRTMADPCQCLYSLLWQVEYMIYPEELNGTIKEQYQTIKTKGRILYLKDQNNNYAYYDFKNIRFKRTLEELNKGPQTFKQDSYVYTFAKGTEDRSNDSDCKNNHLEQGSYNNVFFSTVNNVRLEADTHNNNFYDSVENSYFDYGTYNNNFISPVKSTKGRVHDKELEEIMSMQVPKWFDVLKDKQILVYIDAETETYQIVKL